MPAKHIGFNESMHTQVSLSLILLFIHSASQDMPSPVSRTWFQLELDSDTVTKESRFLYHIVSSFFLICLKILLELFLSIRVLTLMLQKESLNVSYTYSQVDLVSSIQGMSKCLM